MPAQDYIEFFIDPKFRVGVDGFVSVAYGDYAAPEAMLAQAVGRTIPVSSEPRIQFRTNRPSRNIQNRDQFGRPPAWA